MSLRTKSRKPSSTPETASTLFSSSVVSIFSERMAFIGYFPFAFCGERGGPPHDDGAIWASDFGCIAANMRQCPCFSVAARAYQLCLKPAEMLLLEGPSAVSATEPE